MELYTPKKFPTPVDVSVRGRTFVVEPGDEVFVPRGALHSVKNAFSGTSYWLYGYD